MSEILKKPKLENQSEDEDDGRAVEESEQEEALVALIEHRTKEVEHLRQRISYYKSQLEQAEKRLNDSQSKLAKLRSRDNTAESRKLVGFENKNVKVERRSSSPVINDETPSQPRGQSRPQLLIPAASSRIPQPIKSEPNSKASIDTGSRASVALPSQSNGVGKLKRKDSPHRPSNGQERSPSKGTKRKHEQKEHKELIPLIRSSSSPSFIHCQSGVHISSQHKRKLRSLILCPSNDQLFVTSALDGFVNLWQVNGRGSSASLLSSTECASTKQRRWPEDIAWHPDGDRLFSVYTADGGDSQVSMLNLNKTQKGQRVTFLEEKPHFKGIINSVSFMPWADSCFVTGGSDHAVVLWGEKDDGNSYKPKVLHRHVHSSAVMGVAGLQQKQIVMSAGADKRIIGFDAVSGRPDFKHQIETKCMSVVPNPCDFNLFMVQTGAHERQLRLYDIRLRQTEIHTFGWKQESSESQSALINQAWSPDGLYITSGSADPMIHIFDIRYTANKPSQSVKAHQKRVFKAVWLHSTPLLISISSDLQVGLHNIV
ncbi:hypothetical protein Scep_003634 [Stephania cephalantha]|uniref:Uncharacterized protein n=1 Tax=Stephania cephalantha TaxID=152367 RepID=A0AAP0PVY4_9MAGN